MEQEQWLELKMLFLLTWKLLFSEGGLTFAGGGNKNLVGRESTGGGGGVSRWGWIKKILTGRGTPPILPIGKTLLSGCLSFCWIKAMVCYHSSNYLIINTISWILWNKLTIKNYLYEPKSSQSSTSEPLLGMKYFENEPCIFPMFFYMTDMNLFWF